MITFIIWLIRRKSSFLSALMVLNIKNSKGNHKNNEKYIKLMASPRYSNQAYINPPKVAAVKTCTTTLEDGKPSTTGREFLPYARSPSKSSISLMISRIRLVIKAKNEKANTQYRIYIKSIWFSISTWR